MAKPRIRKLLDFVKHSDLISTANELLFPHCCLFPYFSSERLSSLTNHHSNNRLARGKRQTVRKTGQQACRIPWWNFHAIEAEIGCSPYFFVDDPVGRN